jgi:hypothetical protein
MRRGNDNDSEAVPGKDSLESYVAQEMDPTQLVALAARVESAKA